MSINNLKIENVRGLDRLIISSKILKNRPNILVAPNGFGKTSIATAFKCAADQTSIKLEDEERHDHDNNKKATIELELEENGSLSILSATEQARSNDIRKHFDIHVVSDLRKLKATTQWLPGGHGKPKAKMVIDPIVICKKVNRANSPYKISESRRTFGQHKKVLPNIEVSLFQSHDFVMRSPECWQYIDELIKTRKWNQIENVRNQLSNYSGSTDDGLLHIATAVNDLFDNLQEAKELLSIIEATTKLCGVEAFLSFWQMLTLARNSRDALNNHLEWLRYSEIKQSLKDGLNDLNTSWKTPSLKETKGNLVVVMPDPTHISNGQRDVLLLLSLLHIARYNLVKSRAILIVDEVFDYLDDANLTVAQYYISQLIEDYKRQGRSIYTIILTHLNPTFFRNYVFSNQNTIYLENGTAYDSIDAMKKLIGARSQDGYDEALKKNISKYLVHYYSGDYDFTESLKSISGMRSSWGKRGKFQGFLRDEFVKYSGNQPYDPLAICAVTRRSIEELAFGQISEQPDANDFFNTHKTSPKLDWAVQRGAAIPETHYLLRVIFDDGLHWNINRDNTIPIVAKLANPIIKKMIIEVVNKCMESE
ncbi:MAG: hypothetical protein QNL04_01565 [SAR324 cluster bacterium]|nr:hypothetical protein [SAR324 cluster bacterium]